MKIIPNENANRAAQCQNSKLHCINEQRLLEVISEIACNLHFYYNYYYYYSFASKYSIK